MAKEVISAERENSLKETMNAINKKFGSSTLRTGKGIVARRMQTDIPMFDFITDGGFLINRVNEFYGPPSSLKSWYCYLAIAIWQHYDWANDERWAFSSFQFGKRKNPFDIPEVLSYKLRRGYKPTKQPVYKYVLLVDVEGTYDATWGELLGIDNEFLIYYSPDSMDQAVDVVDAFLRNPDVSLVVFDSMIAIGSDDEIEASMEKDQMAINARFWNKATRKITAAMNSNKEKDVTFIAVNGFYDKVGLVFGNPEVVKNGKAFALAKSLSIRTDIQKELKLDIGGVEVIAGRNVKLANKKNKAGQPLREGSLYFSFVDDGILHKGETDVVAQLVELGLRFGVIERIGNGYSWGGYKGKGMESFKKSLHVDKGWKQLKDEVYDVMITK